jgi:hypothetical protein
MRATLPGLGLCALLAGCPLPQSIPSSVGNGPGLQIVFELMSPRTTFIDIAKGCPSRPTFTLRGSLSDVDLTEHIEARWFADYDPISSYGILREDTDVLDGNGVAVLRPLPDFVYAPSDWAGPGYAVHVVEVVVSNGFDPRPNQLELAMPNRTPSSGQSQSFRWVFRYVDVGGACSG